MCIDSLLNVTYVSHVTSSLQVKIMRYGGGDNISYKLQKKKKKKKKNRSKRKSRKASEILTNLAVRELWTLRFTIVQWRHLHIAILLCQNFGNFIVRNKPLMEMQLV